MSILFDQMQENLPTPSIHLKTTTTRLDMRRQRSTQMGAKSEGSIIWPVASNIVFPGPCQKKKLSEVLP